MIRLDENALICDFAETYHVFDYRALPLSRAAALAAGLRDNSRIKMKMAGMQYPPEFLLLSIAVDHLALLLWANTKDGIKGRNRPESIYDRLTGRTKIKASDVMTFASGADFEAAKKRFSEG